MTLKDRIPVEPLTDERYARIEHAIVGALPARRPRPSRWRPVAPWAIAALAAAAALVAWRVVATPAPSPVAPVTVAAAPDGTRVDLGDAVITTGAGASFTVTRPDGGVSIELARGKIELEVAPRRGRGALVVHAADVDVVVVGTHFTVDREPVTDSADEVAVAVTHGVVRVERGGERITLAAGDAWSRNERVAAVAPVEPPQQPDPTIDVLRDRTPRVPEATTTFEGTGSKPPKASPRPKPPKPIVVDDPVGDLRRSIAAQPIATAPEGGVEEQKKYADARDRMEMRKLDLYVARFPDGKQLDEVLWMRLRVYCHRGFDDKCRAAAHTYINRIGAGGKRGELAERVTHTH